MAARGFGFVVVALVFLDARPASSQLAPGVTLQPGADVRVTRAHPDKRLRGTFVAADGDSIWIRRGNVTPSAIPFSSVRQVAVRHGRDRWRGFKYGAALLGGIGVVFGGVDVARGNLSIGEYLVTVIVNGGIGGVVGAAVAPRGWTEIPLQRGRE